MNRKIITYLILTTLWMLVIFNFSKSGSTSSNSLSKGLINNGIDIYEKVFNVNIDNKVVVEKLNYPVRKLAHYTIYLFLGLFIYSIFIHTNINHKELFTIGICFIYALTDEFHQLFVSGRTGQIFDVVVDTSGALTVVLIYKYIINKRKISLQKLTHLNN